MSDLPANKPRVARTSGMSKTERRVRELLERTVNVDLLDPLRSYKDPPPRRGGDERLEPDAT
jgi:hypothetical protein